MSINKGGRHPNGTSPNSAELLWRTMERDWGSYSRIDQWIRVRSKGQSRRWRGRLEEWLRYALPPAPLPSKSAEVKKSVIHKGAKYRAPWKTRMREAMGAFGASVKKILRRVQT